MMRKHRIVIILFLLAVAGGGNISVAAPAPKNPEKKSARMKEASEKRFEKKLSKEEKQRERERKIALRATEATELKVKEGKTPGYNKLLKSSSYELMYTEGLRYYHMTKVPKIGKDKGKEVNTHMNYQKAQSLLGRAYESQAFNGTVREDSLYYYLGSSFYKDGSFEMSEQIFDGFRRTYPNSVFIEGVEYMYAMGFYFLSPEPQYDQQTTLRAMIAISEYESRYPNTIKKEEIATRMDELRRKLYAKSYQNAKLYFTIGQYKAAVRALNNAIDEFPESPYREELMYLATKSAYLFASNSVFSEQTDRYMNMMDNYYNLVSEFPTSKHIKEVAKMRDEALEHISKYTKDENSQTITDKDGSKGDKEEQRDS